MQRAGGQEGVTLIELIVGAAATLVLLAVTLTFTVSALNSEAQNSNRGVKVEELSTALQRFVREARPSLSVAYVGSSKRAVVLSVDGVAAHNVTWDCRLQSGTACGRTVGGVTQTLVTGVSPSAGTVFDLGCRSTVNDATEGSVLSIPAGGVTPAGCGAGAVASNVAVTLGAQTGCAGQPTTSCPTRVVALQEG